MSGLQGSGILGRSSQGYTPLLPGASHTPALSYGILHSVIASALGHPPPFQPGLGVPL